MGGFNRIFDTVGSRATLTGSMRALATNGVISLLGIGKEMKLDLTTLWLKLQTIRGCYGYRLNDVKAGKRQAFEMALDLIAKKKVRVDDMLTHRFRIEEYRTMIEVNMDKAKHKAMKTAVSFV